MTSERPLAEQLARDVLRDPVTHGWLAPLAREYLKEIEAAALGLKPEPMAGTGGITVSGLRESGPA
jgi:hypothetical protein